MAKRKSTVKNNKKIDEVELKPNLKNSIKLVVIILVIVLAFYLLTVLILNKKTKTTYTSNSSIGYTKILAGETFKMKEDEYLVFFYDNNNSTYADYVSKYREKKEGLTLYTVDLSEGLNKKYKANEDNREASKASELKINGATLIHIKSGNIDEYIKDNFDEYLGVLEEKSEEE